MTPISTTLRDIFCTLSDVRDSSPLIGRPKGWLALLNHIHRGQLPELEKLLASDSHLAIYEEGDQMPNFLTSFYGESSFDPPQTALCIAAISAPVEIAKALVAHGANVDGVTASEEVRSSPLFMAILNDNLPIAEFLIAKGANLEKQLLQCSNKVSPLNAAISCGRFSIANLLIEHGADVNQKDESGKTPLFYFLTGALFQSEKDKTGILKQLAKTLVDSGADLSLLDDETVCASLQEKADFYSVGELTQPLIQR
ncbi:MAG: ankyrin repeat domain-containing protein, partial [Chlamydiota bacterium]